MNNFKVRFSLRYKLLLLLVTLPLISLGLYLAMAAELFQKDKVAYVFDSSATVSRSLATQMRIEGQGTYSALRTIVETFDFSARDFNSIGKDLFTKNAKVHVLLLFRRIQGSEFVQEGSLSKDNEPAKKFLANNDLLMKLRERAVVDTVSVSEVESAGVLGVAYRLGEKTDPNQVVMVSLVQADDLLSAFENTGLYSSFVVSRSGEIAIGGLGVVGTDLPLLRPILDNQVKEGTSETRLSDGQIYLISFAGVGIGNLLVISKVDKKMALKAVEVLLAKSILFFVALLASTLLISVFASNRLTSTLVELFEATGRVAQGDFNVSVQANSKDEVGGLAQSFNWMAAEVSRLMNETAEKARMESELSTVRTVQETLFPAGDCQFGPIRITGHFEPASECGGDWWNYSRIGNEIFLWIGDATGHGAPAALITSAARSAAAVIEAIPGITPAKALTVLNRAIHQTSKGQIMMTFFVASIDLDRFTFTYASASHDPPYLMRRTSEKFSKKDLQPLNEVNGPRLGDQKDFVYEDRTITFEPGDLLFLYTDGILDIQNPEGKKWGERTFLKTLVESANSGTDLHSKLQMLRENVDTFRSGTVLLDDVTMVMCEYEKGAA
ncbi:MAG: PP2C family protein-serine/threonine phosphatase [Bdellovibrionales bacterium]